MPEEATANHRAANHRADPLPSILQSCDPSILRIVLPPTPLNFCNPVLNPCALALPQKKSSVLTRTPSACYFLGKFLEVLAKRKTSQALVLLLKAQPHGALLVEPGGGDDGSAESPASEEGLRLAEGAAAGKGNRDAEGDLLLFLLLLTVPLSAAQVPVIREWRLLYRCCCCCCCWWCAGTRFCRAGLKGAYFALVLSETAT